MSYIGNNAGFGKYVKLDSMQSLFNGTLRTFATLVNGSNYQCGSALQLLVLKNGVLLDPLVDFTVSNASITFTTAPINTDVISIRGLGQVFDFPNVSDASVSTNKIQDSAVTSAKIANNSISAQKMQDNAIATGKIIDNAVTSAKIADNAVTVSKITTNAVATDKIADSAVTAVKIADGTITTAKINSTSVLDIKSVKQNSQSAAYTLALTDGGGHILHPSADTTARTYTIPANADVAFPVGTLITIVNQNAAGVITIAINSDTLRLAGSGATGNRTVAANGLVNILKITTTEWIISGIGLS